jgi:hypothetical protein
LLQNQASIARSRQEMLQALDVPGCRIRAAAVDAMMEGLEQRTATPGVYDFLARAATPNFAKALLTLARNQTQLHQLHVACALERFRLAHGRYPEHLDALIPTWLDRVPQDLFADGPLQYRLEGETGYRLWSVGWDEKDNGGVPRLDPKGDPVYDASPADWVWQHSP